MINTYSNIRNVRPIAENVIDEIRIKPYLSEVENLFLIPNLGAALYKEIDDYLKTLIVGEEDPEPTHNADFDLLMTGGFYDSNTKHFTGLNDALGHLTYSRFVRNQNVNATAFGIVQKQGQFSEPVDDKTIVRIAKDAENVGQEYLKQCICYLKFIKKIDEHKSFKKTYKFKTIGR